MSLHHLAIQQFRNLTAVAIELCPKFNVFYGQNGSGKTSLLEAVHYLGLARSFRTHLHQRVIQHQREQFTLFAQIQSGQLIPIGYERQRAGESRIRIAGDNISSPLELAKLLPLQLINSDSHRYLLSAPKFRRQFLDWGVFHVEPNFMPIWQRTHRALKQRNAAIKQRAPRHQIQLWDKELSINAEQLHQLRQQYVANFLPTFQQILQQLLGEIEIQPCYYAGWPEGHALEEMLQTGLSRDLDIGYTQYGPQRADLILKVSQLPAQDVLSQGQLKLAVYALRLAQGLVLQTSTQKACVFLIDDLPAELDHSKRQQVMSVLSELNSQVFITGIERDDLIRHLTENTAYQLFHVEHGSVARKESVSICA